MISTANIIRLLVLPLALVVAQNTWAQQAAPHIGYIYPSGGRQGTTFQVIVGGQNLDNTDVVRVTGTGIKASIAEVIKPLSQQQASILRDKLKELQDKKFAANSTRPTTQPTTRPHWTAEDEKMLEDIRKKLATFIPRNQLNPAIAETVTLQIAINPTAEIGDYELRLKTPMGFSNPMIFNVDNLPEISRDSAKQVREGRNGAVPKVASKSAEIPLKIPVTVNGQILPGEVHHYRFIASKGQHLVAVVRARDLIPYLADAVPGWFQATLAIYDAKGKELVYNDHFRFNPDPVIYCQIPADGEYVVEIKDSLYRGREDFVYRLSLGEIPYVTGIFPLGGQVGKQTRVQLSGWNLPVSTLPTIPADSGTIWLSGTPQQPFMNRVPFATDTLPECRDHENNQTQETAQQLTLPTIVNGRISRPDEQHVYRFEGRVGENIVAEVTARRLASPVDSVLKLTDASGKQLAINDDYIDKSAGLLTHHADSLLNVTLPSNGTYFLYLADTQHQGGNEYSYRLRLSEPHPDFDLRVVPSSINVRAGTSAAVTVYAISKDGFTGDIALALKNAPKGFILNGAKIPANQEQVKMTLSVPPAPNKEPFLIRIDGRAVIQGVEVIHSAQPAEDMMQAFAYHQLVVSQELLLAILERPAIRNPFTLRESAPLKISASGNNTFHIQIPQAITASEVQFELTDPPPGITIQRFSPSPQGMEIVLKCDATLTKPGAKGNLIIAAFVEKTPPGSENSKGPKRRVSLGTLPAISYVTSE